MMFSKKLAGIARTFAGSPAAGGKKVHALVVLALGLFFLVLPARALTFNITYDASVTNLANAAQVESAFATATQTFQNLFSNSMTVNLTVYWGENGPFTNKIDLGESITQFRNNTGFAYVQLTNALFAVRTSAADSNSVASLPASNPTATNKWWIPRAEAKALGVLISPTDTNVDGSIGFASDQSYTFDATNRAVPGEFDFIGVAEHEISETMGRTYLLSRPFTGFAPYDLFRFTNSGGRSFNVNDQGVYFSVDNGVTALKFFYGDVNTGDIQDWVTSTPQDSFDAFVTSGEESAISTADIEALDILGYNLTPVSAPHLTGARLSNGNFQLTFTNAPFTSFTVLASTNASQALTNWTVLGTAAEPIAGHYQFNDTLANKTRFYKVRTP